MVMVDTKEVPAKAEVPAFTVVDEKESELTLESWITNKSTFNVPAMQVETESELNLLPEPWMFDEDVFLPAFNVEPALELEAWSTCSFQTAVPSFSDGTPNDKTSKNGLSVASIVAA